MKTDEERGRYGRWLKAMREERKLKTAKDAHKAMAGAGIVVGTSAYAEYEAGTKQPSKVHLPLLEQFYGPITDWEARALNDSASGVAHTEAESLVKAMDRQTAAIRDQTAMLAAVLSALSTPQLTPEGQAWVAEQVEAAIRNTRQSGDRSEQPTR